MVWHIMEKGHAASIAKDLARPIEKKISSFFTKVMHRLLLEMKKIRNSKTGA